MGGHRHDRHTVAARLLGRTDRSRRSQPVHLRHLHVHQDDVVSLGRGLRDGLPPVAGNVDRVLVPPQQSDRELLVRDAVLGQQDSQPAQGAVVGRVVGGGGAWRHVERLGDRVVQLRLLDRLGHEPGDAEFPRPLAVARPVTAGEHQNDRRVARAAGHVVQSPDHLEAVDPGHLRVGQHDRERLAGASGLLDRLQRIAGTGRCLDLHAPVVEHLLQDAAIGPVVVDHEHPQPAERVQLRPRQRVVRDAQVDLEGECAALPRHAGQLDLPAHQGDQPGRDRQTQPGAAEPPGGAGVGLLEGVEDGLLAVVRDADAGVGHGQPQPNHPAGRLARRSVDGADIEHDLAAFGELDGVADQVYDDLP